MAHPHHCHKGSTQMRPTSSCCQQDPPSTILSTKQVIYKELNCSSNNVITNKIVNVNHIGMLQVTNIVNIFSNAKYFNMKPTDKQIKLPKQFVFA